MITAQDIFGVLNTQCTEVAKFVVSNGEKINVRTFLPRLAELENSDVNLILDYCELSREKFKRLLAAEQGYRTPFDDRPPEIIFVDLVCASMVFSAAKLRSHAVRSAAVLLTYTGDARFNCNQTLSHMFRTKKVFENILGIIENSCEDSTPFCLSSDPSPRAAVPKKDWLTDLTAEARAGRLDPVVGREREIRQVAEILCRRRQNNPCLLGDPGVGKTACVEGLALLVAAGDAPKIIKDCTIYSLNMGEFMSGTAMHGETEKRVVELAKTIKSKNSIIFIDEIHTIASPMIPTGKADVGTLLKPALARGEIRCVGATTFGEYKMTIARDGALARRFHPVTVSEPTPDETRAILAGLKPSLEKHHDIIISDDAISSAVDLSCRYIHDRKQPDKAISVLDAACVRAGSAALGAGPVAEIVSEWSGVSVDNMRGMGEDAYLAFADALGLPGPAVVDHMKKCRSLNVPTCILIRSSASGVSPSLREAARLLYGTDRALLTVNMSAHSDHHSVSSLRGSPQGYVGSMEGGYLTEHVRRRPASLVAAIDPELAHPVVLSLFSEISEYGEIKDGVGNIINFSNAVIIMISEHPAFRVRSENFLALTPSQKQKIIV